MVLTVSYFFLVVIFLKKLVYNTVFSTTKGPNVAGSWLSLVSFHHLLPFSFRTVLFPTLPSSPPPPHSACRQETIHKS